jgi:hypothetical protein
MKKLLLSLFLVLFSTSTYAGWNFETIAMVGLPRSIAMTYGPADQAYGEIWQTEFGPRGEIYLTGKYRMGLYRIENGQITRIAGLERRGYRDGPAEFAMFNWGGSGYPRSDLAVDSSGNIYITDGYNEVVRKVYKNKGKWYVSTFAGGGRISRA